MGLVAPWHVGSSRARARTRVPCIGRRILNHCATRQVLRLGILKFPDYWTFVTCELSLHLFRSLWGFFLTCKFFLVVRILNPCLSYWLQVVFSPKIIVCFFSNSFLSCFFFVFFFLTSYLVKCQSLWCCPLLLGSERISVIQGCSPRLSCWFCFLRFNF